VGDDGADEKSSNRYRLGGEEGRRVEKKRRGGRGIAVCFGTWGGTQEESNFGEKERGGPSACKKLTSKKDEDRPGNPVDKGGKTVGGTMKNKGTPFEFNIRLARKKGELKGREKKNGRFLSLE